MRTMKAKLALVALLTVFVGGCQKQNKTGEAFVVLKSGEVIYMADMEVVCLKPNFKSDFSGWKAEYDSKDKTLVGGIQTGNPALRAKLKEIDDSIGELNSKISGISGEEKKISDNLIGAIESERNLLVAEIAKKNDVRDEYKQIVEPIDKQIKELEIEAGKIEQEQNALKGDTLQKINAYIVESNLTVTKLKPETADSLFETDTDNDESRPTPITFDSSATKPFLVKKRRDPALEGWSYWIFLINVPAELEGTPSESLVKAAYQKWLDTESRLKNVNKNLRLQKARRDQQLIPWQNSRSISPSEGQELIELEKRQKATLAQLNENLSVFKAGGIEARTLVQKEIKKSILKLNESLDLLNQHRREFLQDAASTARNDLKAEYRQKFYALVKKDAVAAVRTGSKGDFIISGETAYLYAETQRNNGEKLVWLERIDPKAPKIKMSVSNAASVGSDDFDDFWMLHWSLPE